MFVVSVAVCGLSDLSQSRECRQRLWLVDSWGIMVLEVPESGRLVLGLTRFRMLLRTDALRDCFGDGETATDWSFSVSVLLLELDGWSVEDDCCDAGRCREVL